MSRPATFAVLALVLSTLSLFAQSDDDTDDNLLKRAREVFVTEPEMLEDVVPLHAARQSGEFNKLRELSTEIIERSDKDFDTLPIARFTKSLAFQYRARANQHLGNSSKVVMDDLLSAARLGQRDAILTAASILAVNYENGNSLKDRKTDAHMITDLYRKAARLGDFRSAQMLGKNYIPVPLSESECAYWKLVGTVGDFRREHDGGPKQLQNLVEEIGNTEVLAALREHSIVQAPVDSHSGLPQRGLVATLYVEQDLLSTYDKLFESFAADTKNSPEQPKLLELFRLFQWMNKDIGGYCSPYLLVPGEREYEDKSILSIRKEDIGECIAAGDRIVVRTFQDHIAVVYKVDREKQEIWLADPAHDFWFPSKNPMIKKSRMVETPDGRFLTVISTGEMVEMLRAAIVFRDNRLPTN